MGCDFNLASGRWAEEDNVELRKFLTRDEIKIQELEEENTTLKQSVKWYKNREKELLEQIEKMKSCRSCKNNYCSYWKNPCCECENHSSWELKNEKENYKN